MIFSAPARIRKGQGAEALNRALSDGREIRIHRGWEWKGMTTEGGGSRGGGG